MAPASGPPFKSIQRHEIARRPGVAYPLRARRAPGLANSSAKSALRAPWLLLYALLPVCVALLAFAEGIPWTGGLRALVEIVIVCLVIGLAAIWVHANRRALAGAQANGRDKEVLGQNTILQVNASSPRVIHLDSHRHGS